MKIKLFHDVCGREVLVRQVLDSGGHCPWDGLPFTREYTAMLTDALRTVEEAGGALESSLEKIAGMDPTLMIHRESLLGPIEAHLEELNRRKVGPRT